MPRPRPPPKVEKQQVLRVAVRRRLADHDLVGHALVGLDQVAELRRRLGLRVASPLGLDPEGLVPYRLHDAAVAGAGEVRAGVGPLPFHALPVPHSPPHPRQEVQDANGPEPSCRLGEKHGLEEPGQRGSLAQALRCLDDGHEAQLERVRQHQDPPRVQRLQAQR
eukprot:11195275-Lingulodinium_polyedra.AAC.1